MTLRGIVQRDRLHDGELVGAVQLPDPDLESVASAPPVLADVNAVAHGGHGVAFVQ
jgi:hypothetical protein